MRHSTDIPFSRLTHLGDLSIAKFLESHWQQSPMLARRVFPAFKTLISADKLAGLTLEDDVVSRLIVEKTKSHWSLEHGPFTTQQLTELPDSHWTLLVQQVDRLDTHINALLDAFRFIPNWRLDDIMVSYASDAGSVGPHFDYFDVFLLQAEGKKRWRLGQTCDTGTALLPDAPMRILKEFHTRQEWVLEPGDLLYIPPGVAHWGEALGESITYSIGFRAPSYSEVLLEYSQEIASELCEDQRYRDGIIHKQPYPGEITTQAVRQFKHILQQLTSDETRLSQWVGEYTTQFKQTVEPIYRPLSTNQLLSNGRCQLSPYCRAAFHRLDEAAQCFINGHHWHCSLKLAILLTEYKPMRYKDHNAHDQSILEQLTSYQWLIPYGGANDI